MRRLKNIVGHRRTIPTPISINQVSLCEPDVFKEPLTNSSISTINRRTSISYSKLKGFLFGESLFPCPGQPTPAERVRWIAYPEDRSGAIFQVRLHQPYDPQAKGGDAS